MSFLICRKYIKLNTTKSWTVSLIFRKFTNNKNLNNSNSINLKLNSILSNQNLICSNYKIKYESNPSSILLQNYFSTKIIQSKKNIDENLVNEDEKKIKLDEGEIAVEILHDIENGNHVTNKYSENDVQEKCKKTISIFKSTSYRSYLNNYGPMYKSACGLESEVKYIFSHSKNLDKWKCILKMKQPLNLELKTVSSSKSGAGEIAALLAINQLYTRRLISNKGRPILNEDIKKTSNQQPHQPIDKIESFENFDSLYQLKHLTNTYDSEIFPLVQEFEEKYKKKLLEDKLAMETTTETADPELSIDEEFMSQITKFQTPNLANERYLERRNEQLYRKAKSLADRDDMKTNHLPIYSFK